MKEKFTNFLRACDNFVRRKYSAQDGIFLAIKQFNDGLITYAECQYQVYTYLQTIQASFLEEFKANKFF